MLLTPGPTPVPEFVRDAMSKQSIHHRTAEFEDIFKQTKQSLLKLLDMDDCLMLSCSGTGAMEAAMINLTSTKALVINAGKFGERFAKIAQSHNIPHTQLKYDWDTHASIDEVINTIKSDDKIDAFFIQICESAGGLRHPVEEIAKAIKSTNKNIMVVADGITSVGVEKIDTENIDVLITGSQKALMLPPGLAMMGLSTDAIEKINSNKKGFYFDLSKELIQQNKNTTAYTPATTLIIGLQAMLERLEEIGLDNLYQKTAKLSYASREALKAININIYPSSPANAMTTARIDNANAIRKILKDTYNVNIAGGQDFLNDKIFRINHMGLVEDYEMSWALNSIEKTLEQLKIRNFDGSANKVFMDLYFN